MSKKKGQTSTALFTATPTQAPLPTTPIEDIAAFYNMPDSAASNLIYDILEAGQNLDSLPASKQTISRKNEYKVVKGTDKKTNKAIRKITMDGEKASVTITLNDAEKVTNGSNKPAKKLFVLSLIKANSQCLQGGQLTQDYISFPLQELVDIGNYKNVRSARTGFLSGADTLTSIKAKGTLKKSTKSKKAGNEIEIAALEVLFTGAKIEKGQCFIYLNERVNWGFLCEYYTILPPYYFRLSNRASDLLYYIFYLARQHTKEIEEKGYFNISFRAIQNKLQLPNEKGLNNPQRDIKDAIEGAIEQIEDAHKATYGNMDIAFIIQPDGIDGATISEYLDNGYLRVEIKGNFASKFIALSKDTRKQITESQKRQARIQDKIETAIAEKKAKEATKPTGEAD